MRFKKIIFVHLIILLLTLLTVRAGFSQGKGTGAVSFTGIIESISEDLKYIVINETRITLSPSTQVMDENGNKTRAEVLRPELYVAVEALQKRDGFLARKIVVKKRKGV